MDDTTSRREPATPAGATSSAEAALATVRDVTAELVRLVRNTATQATDGWTLASVARSISPTLERMFAEHDALEQRLRDLAARAHAAESTLAARETAWRAERAALETEVAREQEQVHVLTQEAERRTKDFDLVAARERRLREQMETVAARANADREETLRLAREMVQSAEEARFAVVDEMEALRAALAAEQARLVEIQHERARATEGAAERDAELARARQMIEQLEGSRASTAAELARTRTTLMHADGELLSAQHEYQLAQVQIEKLCAAHDDMVEDRAQLVARLHDAKEREARLRLRIAGLEQRIHEMRGGVDTAPAELPATAEAESAASALATELSRAEERTRALERELAAAKAAAIAASTRIADLQAQARAAEVARMTAAAEAEVLRARLETPSAPVEAAPAANEPLAVEKAAPAQLEATPGPIAACEPTLVSDPPPIVAEDEVAEVEPIVPDDDEPAQLFATEEIPVPDDVEEIVEDEPAVFTLAGLGEETDATVEAPAVATEPTPDARSLAVLDTAEPWQGAGVDAAFVPVGPSACDIVRELVVDACVVNLATPGALATAAALRTAGVTVPFWACAIPADGAGFAIGAFDVVTRPIDPESVRRQLAALIPAGGNVVSVGSDSSTQIPLRQGLLQAGMTVKTAWDRKQANDLTDTVRPEIVIVDLASEAAGGADLIVDLAFRARPPLIVIVPGTAQQVEALETSLAAHAAARGTSDRAALLASAAAPR